MTRRCRWPTTTDDFVHVIFAQSPKSERVKVSGCIGFFRCTTALQTLAKMRYGCPGWTSSRVARWSRSCGCCFSTALGRPAAVSTDLSSHIKVLALLSRASTKRPSKPLRPTSARPLQRRHRPLERSAPPRPLTRPSPRRRSPRTRPTLSLRTSALLTSVLRLQPARSGRRARKTRRRQVRPQLTRLR